MACRQCQLQTTSAVATTTTNVAILAILVGLAITGIYYLSKGK